MNSETELILSNIGNLVSAVLIISLGSFVWWKGRNKPSNIFFFIMSVFCTIFLLSHVIGTNTTDPELSRRILMFNLSNIVTAASTVGLIFSSMGLLQKLKKELILVYSIGFALIAFFLVFPRTFLETSRPILYFPNYYTGGSLYSLMLVYFFAAVLYCLFEGFKFYVRSDYAARNRIKYLMFLLIIGYGFGSLDFLPVYGIRFDPILSILIGLSMAPVAIGILKSNLMDINIVAKRAVVYSMAVALVSMMILGVNSYSNLLAENYPNFPVIIIPVGSAIVFVFLAVFIWKKMREAEVLKYEFINVVTHKFRTPITYIKWSLDDLEDQNSQTHSKSLDTIKRGISRLFELTDTLLDTVESDNLTYAYNFESVSLAGLVHEAVGQVQPQADQKGVHVELELPDYLSPVKIDAKRMRVVVNTLIENGVIYTPKGGSVNISASEDKKSVTLAVQDTGIGVGKSDLPLIFNEFYRSKPATTSSTEGMGIGLYISKGIVKRHNGSIWAESEGEGKGSTFFLKLRKA